MYVLLIVILKKSVHRYLSFAKCKCHCVIPLNLSFSLVAKEQEAYGGKFSRNNGKYDKRENICTWS